MTRQIVSCRPPGYVKERWVKNMQKTEKDPGMSKATPIQHVDLYAMYHYQISQGRNISIKHMVLMYVFQLTTSPLAILLLI